MICATAVFNFEVQLELLLVLVMELVLVAVSHLQIWRWFYGVGAFTAEVLVVLEGLESATAATVTPTQPPTLHWPHQQSSVAAYTALHNGMRDKRKHLRLGPKIG